MGADRADPEPAANELTQLRLVSRMRELERENHSSHTIPSGLALVGSGRVGQALARSAADAGFEARLAGRDDAFRACLQSEAALLCVPDTAIAGACRDLSDAIPPLRFVGHTSGATGLDALASATARGASGFSLHPLQTIPDSEATLAGAPCAVSGSDAGGVDFARELAERLGMRPFAVPEESRAAYHAAACLASNFLVALEESAAELLRGIGIEDARQLLAPLVLRTAANWSERGADALTGPIARGDEQTVEQHLEALAERAPELLDLYRTLAERTRSLTGREALA